MLRVSSPILFGAFMAAATLAFRPAFSTPLDDIPIGEVPVGDALEAEIRALEIGGDSLRLPRRGMLPNQVIDLPAFDRPLSPASEISRVRLLRSLARDRGLSGVPGATPRIFQLLYGTDERLEASVGLDGRGTVAKDHDPELASGSGIRLRFAA